MSKCIRTDINSYLDFHSFNTNLINMIRNNTSVGNLIDEKKMKEVCKMFIVVIRKYVMLYKAVKY